MSTQQRLPTGDGQIEINWFFKDPDGTYYYSNVDDPIGTPDDDLTLIAGDSDTTAAYRYCCFSFGAFSIPANSAISNISVTIRHRKSESSSNISIKAALKIGGIRYYSDPIIVSNYGSYRDNVFSWITNPTTGAAWTASEANSIEQFGVYPYLSIDRYYVFTQIYCTATYSSSLGFSAGGAGGGTGGDMSTGFSFGAA